MAINLQIDQPPLFREGQAHSQCSNSSQRCWGQVSLQVGQVLQHQTEKKRFGTDQSQTADALFCKESMCPGAFGLLTENKKNSKVASSNSA